MKNKKNILKTEKGFTLLELLIVIAIIGILSSIVTVSMGGSVEKSKRASALSTGASSLPELVTCNDDSGFVKATPVSGEVICWKTNAYVAAADGHASTVWQDINAKTGWSYAAGVGTIAGGDYTFTMTKAGQTPSIACDMLKNTCCDDTDGDKKC